MRIDVFSIFPTMVGDFASQSLLGRAAQKGLLDIRVHDLREHTTDVHRTVDDSPFGGGAGMVLRAEPIYASVEAAEPPRPLFLLGPGGRRLDQNMAKELAETGGFSMLCGRYEGVDDRVRTDLCDGELSIGDYVLGGGEVAAMVVLEAVGRLIPGVMGNAESAGDESVLPESPTGASDQQLATAGLDIPSSGDSMAPWWFWLIIVLAIIGLVLGWLGKRRGSTAGQSIGAHQASRPMRKYRGNQQL